MRAHERLGHLALQRAHRRLGAQCGAGSCSVCVFQGSAREAGTLARSEDAQAGGYGCGPLAKATGAPPKSGACSSARLRSCAGPLLDTAAECTNVCADLMYEQTKALKEGKSVDKPIYNHVTGKLDAPETIQSPKMLVRSTCIDGAWSRASGRRRCRTTRGPSSDAPSRARAAA